MRLIVETVATIEHFIEPVNYDMLKAVLRNDHVVSVHQVQDCLGRPDIDLKRGTNIIIFESLMLNEQYEYLLIAVVLRFETIFLEDNIVDLIEACVAGCHSIHSDFEVFIAAMLKKIDPGFSAIGKDDIKSNYEQRYAPYKEEIRSITKENLRLKDKFKEYFDLVLLKSPAKSFRLDFLLIMYEIKLNKWELHKERVASVLRSFKRLDDCMQPANHKDPVQHFYLNSFILANSCYPSEVEVLKNEYFLKTMNMYLTALLRMVPTSLKRDVLKIILEGVDPEPVIDELCQESEFDQNKYEVLLDETESCLAELMVLIDANPPEFFQADNLGTGHERLYTKENFFKCLLITCGTETTSNICKIYHESAEFKKLLEIKTDICLPLSPEMLKRRTLGILETSFEVIRKSMKSLSVLYERSKSKYKDAHFFLKSGLVMKDYTEAFFKNPQSETHCESLSAMLNEDNFNKNIDVSFKFEPDLKLNYLFNNPVYKNNFRFAYFDLLSPSELENVKTFKKIERIAFKEYNPLYLIFSFKSMEFNLRDLFRKIYKSISRDTDIITSEDFGCKIDSLSKFMNDNEDINFVAHDKKHYDIKNTKSLISYVKNTPKPSMFDLLASYIFEIYSALCHCYTFCRTKKVQMAKKFYEQSMGKSCSSSSTLNALLEENPADQGFKREDNLDLIINTLRDIHANTNAKEICRDFRREYLTDLEKLLRSVLTEEYCNPDSKSKVNPFRVFDYIGGKKKKGD